jgi:hypothetical protein
VLTRTGDTTDPLEVAISWDGEIATETTVSPTVAEFVAGSATTTITPVFESVPTVVGTLFLTVEAGVGYQVGEPATHSAEWNFILALCPAPPLPPGPPPIVAGPSFTG